MRVRRPIIYNFRRANARNSGYARASINLKYHQNAEKFQAANHTHVHARPSRTRETKRLDMTPSRSLTFPYLPSYYRQV